MEGPVPQVPPHELQKALAGATPPFLLDVRNPPELQMEGKIGPAVNVPSVKISVCIETGNRRQCSKPAPHALTSRRGGIGSAQS